MGWIWRGYGQRLGRQNGRRGGGGGYRRGRDGDILSRWEDNVASLTLGTNTNALLDYDPGLEHHHPILITLGDPGGRLYRERYQ